MTNNEIAIITFFSTYLKTGILKRNNLICYFFIRYGCLSTVYLEIYCDESSLMYTFTMMYNM